MGSLFTTKSQVVTPFNQYQNTFNPYAAGNPADATAKFSMDAVGQQVEANIEQAGYAVQDAGLQEQQIARNASQFREQQANAYNGSGVLLEGSPMLVLNQTRQLAQQQIDMLAQKSRVQSELFLRTAMAAADQGRAALLGQDMQFASAANQFQADQITGSNNFNSQVAQARAGASVRQSPLASALIQAGTLFGGGRSPLSTSPSVPFSPYTDPNGPQMVP